MSEKFESSETPDKWVALNIEEEQAQKDKFVKGAQEDKEMGALDSFEDTMAKMNDRANNKLWDKPDYEDRPYEERIATEEEKQRAVNKELEPDLEEVSGEFYQKISRANNIVSMAGPDAKIAWNTLSDEIEKSIIHNNQSNDAQELIVEYDKYIKAIDEFIVQYKEDLSAKDKQAFEKRENQGEYKELEKLTSVLAEHIIIISNSLFDIISQSQHLRETWPKITKDITTQYEENKEGLLAVRINDVKEGIEKVEMFLARIQKEIGLEINGLKAKEDFLKERKGDYKDYFDQARHLMVRMDQKITNEWASLEAVLTTIQKTADRQTNPDVVIAYYDKLISKLETFLDRYEIK